MATKNRLYPHLLAEDIELWEQWLGDHRNDYVRYDYDVRVGLGRDPGDDFPGNIRQMGVDLSQRRIDVVGYSHSHIAIIEITLHAGIKAIGQLTTYPLLYMELFNPRRPLKKILIYREKSDDIDGAIVAQGIFTYSYPYPPATSGEPS